MFQFQTMTTKRRRDDDSDSDDEGGASLNPGFKVNEEYARRFEHNKKREEKHRCKLDTTTKCILSQLF